MAFHIDTNGLRCMDSFAEAQTIFESIKPIRGKTIRPLRKFHRNDRNKVIEKGEDSDGLYYVAKLYTSEVVKYYENGLIRINIGGWTTVSTSIFIHALLGRYLNCFKRDNAIWISTKHNDPTCPTIYEWKYYKIQPSTTLDIRIEEGVVKVLNPLKLYKKSLNRKTTKSLRARVKPLFDYFAAMSKLQVPVTQEDMDELCTNNKFSGYTGVMKAIRTTLGNALLFDKDALPESEMAQFYVMVKGWKWEGNLLSMLYFIALENNIVTHDKLYVYEPVEEGLFLKGLVTI